MEICLLPIRLSSANLELCIHTGFTVIDKKLNKEHEQENTVITLVRLNSGRGFAEE